jgi:hypothetical protein
MTETLLIKCLGRSPVLRIIDFFLDNRLFDYTKDEIIENLDMGRATLFKYWEDIEKFGIVKETRKIGKATLYKLNEENEIVKKLILLDKVLSRQAMEHAIQSRESQETAPV